jgi:hypothetical protein
MSDEIDRPFYAPDRKPAPPRQPRPGELVWSVRNRAHRQIDCELRDHGQWGTEVQLFSDREFLFGHRWPDHASAREEAEDLRAQYLREGGVAIS